MNGRVGSSLTPVDDEYNHLYKIVLVGDAAVGKTHLVHRYIKGYLPKTITPTIGVEFATRVMTLKTGGRVKTQIWDTAGQERYRAITGAHYRKAVGALVVYDITKEKSFENVAKWIEELKYNAEPDIVIMLVGNKVDLSDSNPNMRKVKYEDAAKFAASNGILFCETSAVSAQNVSDAFEDLLQEIYDVRNRKHLGAAPHRTGPKGQKLYAGNNDQAESKTNCC
mmetsp:Transcript_28489/g.32944  ORF Transcript_28489/g.32944 Transcript_28489/m.32944 type:complete len:224 (+) Transcript_28489:53-724(+)|eukprot:CAMPEP_0176441120 /NCGR_PEP_ID=MMETSP0127-20121128/21004_1 /TAXON_ID=938130 /ORGANISM="Platyophrya macrostoma, Strain WH" /LENGTH=223 /DNA_ID=CAMNT_0017825829 /DNA_START=48 /DNA_END=719 /DNA_ORIENTATION=-